MSSDSVSKASRTASEVRASFLDFFKSKGHEVCPSASLVPQNDPTLMFTNAGMVPFKDVFTGKDKRPFTRATSSQKCIRISGKHNDLENVGVTARHHTFFEMLGNFSFGDYFKEEAIAWAWELVTSVWQLPKERLVVTVFGGAEGIPADDEARAIWRKVTGFGDDRILGIPGVPGDNFWQMGDAGPCGPCTEVHYFSGDGEPNLAAFGKEPTPDGKGWMELWNLVFMQFDRSGSDEAGYTLSPLPKPCVDTGAGLERVSSVLQGKTSNYDTDLLRALVDKAAEIAQKPYRSSQSDDDVSMRVIADHARLTAFLVAEGILPDRAGRPYVLRRVMRRAIRHGHRLGIQRPFLHEVALEVVNLMGDQYPELRERKALIASTAEQEEVRFRETIDRGLKILDDEVAKLKAAGQSTLPGKVVFDLEATYGFPNDLTEVIARERGVHIDYAGYKDELERHRKLSEGSKIGDEAVGDVWRHALAAVRAAHGGDEKAAVEFTGYEREEGEGKVLFIAHNRDNPDHPTTATKRADNGDKVAIVTDVTPFYGESGGQVGDKGEIRTKSGGRVRVLDTQKPLAGLVVHFGEVVEGAIEEGETVELEVDHALRTATRRNHSATHLLHWALRTVVGESAQQKGSLVAPDRLRFDYSSGRPLTPEEIQRIEDLVNQKILSNAPVQTEVLPQAEARKRGAIAIFEEKYGDVVRVLTMTKDSVELCGGTHARALGEIGMFKILSESSVAAGVRRIEAATGLNALAYVRQLEGTVRNAARLVKAAPQELPEKVERLLEETKKLDKELAEAKRKLALGGGGVGGGGGIERWAQGARDLPFGKALAVKVDVADAAMLRELAEKLRDKLGDSIVLVGSVAGPKAMLVLAVSKSLTDRFKAGELIRPIAQVLGGSGGGRPDMAQAGGTDVAKIDQALEKLYALVS
jgi:alanyl-tRNA synthetase